jgi:hypothetical protein
MPDSARTEASATTDHGEIRRWVEERDGKPAVVASTHDAKASGILRIEFPGYEAAKDDNLEPIGWDEFFKIFDKNHLAFLHQDRTASGETSRFFKFVER